MGLISRKLCRFLLVFDWLYFTQCLTSFSSNNHLPCLYAWFFILFHLIKVPSINPSANVFVFGDFNVYHKDWLTYSGGNDRLVNSDIIFLSQTALLRWLTFLLGSKTVILPVLLVWICFFLLMLVFVLQWFSVHWEILIMLLSQFPLIFHQIHNRIPHFIALLMTILKYFRDYLRDVPWEDIFKPSAAASEIFK